VPGPLAGLLGGSGRPLPAQERDYFETRFGHDFGRVRVHTDARAARSAEALNARAYTSGNDVVFGPGQYSPESGEGRRLLAHELTHVVQQARGAAPLIQRQLKVTGAKADIKAMLTLLGTASGLTLTHDPKTRLVSWAAAKTKAKTISPELAATLKTIIDDPKKDAELNLGRKQEGVSFGQFPPDLTNPIQEIRIDQMLALEKGAPGAGAAKLGHEISENYTGHGLATYDWGTAFELSHMEGLRVENAVEKELGHPGERRNTFKVLSKKGKKNILTEIEDRSQYFLVFEQDFDAGTGAVLNPRRVPRLKVAAHTIDGFSAGSTDIPKGQEKNLQALADDMKKNPTASALAEGFASAARTGADNENLARKWAELVQDKTIKAVGDVINTSWRRFTLQGSFAKGRNQVVVTLERPDL
jgi:outer membrane protein OmpA-like peptidoglycan-associated protein